MAKNFQLTHILAQNRSFTSVYAAFNVKSNELFTVKISDLESVDDSQSILAEVSRTKHIRHQNILSLIECFVEDSQIWCVYPFMYYGSCKDILECINSMNLNENDSHDGADEQRRLCFNEQSLQPITKSILNALDYLHSKHIIHRCVCPENIYISQSGNVYLSGFKYSVSLIDQGQLAKKLHDYPSNINDYVNYLSPEFLQQNLIGYNTKTDIYSFGITLCELANGVNPFIGCDKAQMLLEKLSGFDVGLWDRSILTPESNIYETVCEAENPAVIASIKRRYFSDKFRHFVDLCVQRQPEARPTASQLSQHIYLKKIKLNNVVSTLGMSVLADGIVDLQKKLLIESQATASNNSNRDNQNGYATSQVNPMTITTTNSSNNTHPDDYDEVPAESIQNSLWNFDN